MSDFKLKVTINDGSEKIIDLQNFIKSVAKGYLEKYADKKFFAKVYLDKFGIPCWGNNEMDICPEDIIAGKYDLKKTGGRKPISDKKVLLRLYIRQSIIDSHGGIEAAQEKCTDYLNKSS